MGDYNIITCCDTGDGGGGGEMDCPLVLEIKDEGRTYSTTGFAQFYWDILKSSPLTGWGAYDKDTGILTISQAGTYRLDLTLVTFIESSATPWDYISIITKEGSNFLMNNHNTPNGTDSVGNSHSHRIVVVRPEQLPYNICWFEQVKEVPPNDTLTLVGRLTNFSVTKQCDETPLEVDVTPSFGGGT